MTGLALSFRQRRVLAAAFVAGRERGLDRAGSQVVLSRDRCAQRSTWEPLVSRGLLELSRDQVRITQAGVDLHWLLADSKP